MLYLSDMDFLICLKKSVRQIKCYCMLTCPLQLQSFPSVESRCDMIFSPYSFPAYFLLAAIGSQKYIKVILKKSIPSSQKIYYAFI